MAGFRALLRNVVRAKERASVHFISARRQAAGATHTRNPACGGLGAAELDLSLVALGGFKWHNCQQLAVAIGGERFSTLAKSPQDGQSRCSFGPGVRRLGTGSSSGYGRKTVIRGKYEIIRELGAGAFGVVMLGRTVATGEAVAIKIFDRDDLEDPVDRRKLSQREDLVMREIYAMMAVRHPNITRLYDVSATIKRIFLVMEYLPGGDLINRIERKGRFLEAEGRKHFQSLIDAMHFCHTRGVYHRDLKPDNLLLDANNVLKVSDFGLAGLKPLDDLTLQGPTLKTLAGSRPYMAPEVLFSKGRGFKGGPNDIWACGVILFIFLAGYHPFWDENLPSVEAYRKIKIAEYICPNFLTPGAQGLLAKILVPDPAARISSADIYNDPWFRVGYVSPSFRLFRDVDDDLKAIENSFSQPEPDEQEIPTFSAFDLLSQTNPVGEAMGPLFHRLGRDTRISSETRFKSHLPPHEILHQIATVVETNGFTVEIKRFKMKMDNVATAVAREPLCVVAEVSSLVSSGSESQWPGQPANAGLFMVVLRRITGSPSHYLEFIEWLAPQISNTIVQVGPTPLP